ncbi:nuclear transport factor 2 family protein [uncultured Winogradskyella sp.]|uniref:nuclear transport factor 2 family protein n=1 Tax=uncultured Winogradskyella sp. TaxID=395353 RepID=UPI00260A1B04|nr:nuclear transport factor 2 family protein [uncultured Winogradskyella sp.]
MLKKVTLTILFFALSINLSSAQSLDNLKAINSVWSKFYKAFETLDYTLMAEIHSKDLVRISGGKRIINYTTYINNYKAGFKRDKESNQSQSISLRFFERINNDSAASERGIYKLVRNKGTENEQAYYGQFHVLFKKTNGEWKITMDYDSSEGETIGEEDYKKAFAIDDFDKFLN